MRDQNVGIELRRPDNSIGLPVGKTSHAKGSISDCTLAALSLTYTPQAYRLEKSIPASDRNSFCFS